MVTNPVPASNDITFTNKTIINSGEQLDTLSIKNSNSSCNRIKAITPNNFNNDYFSRGQDASFSLSRPFSGYFQYTWEEAYTNLSASFTAPTTPITAGQTDPVTFSFTVQNSVTKPNGPPVGGAFATKVQISHIGGFTGLADANAGNNNCDCKKDESDNFVCTIL